ncbi:MAG: pentapeptide repeat-containing protein [Bdellovibrionales bacterium]|nr:pentapeptide repeat-containing protein [Bdellovibrionales bacterium]
MKEREMRVFLKIIFLNLVFVLSCQQVSPEVDFPIEPEVSQVNLSSIGEESSELETSSLEEESSELKTSSSEEESFELESPSSEEETSELESPSSEEESFEIQLSSAQDKSKCNITNYKYYLKYEDDFKELDKTVRETGCKDKGCLGKGCQLEGADFSNQDLRGFIFNNANLRGANFKMANIEGAKFVNADLTDANLETNLDLSDFTDALLKNASYDSMLRFFSVWGGGIASPDKREMVDIHEARLAEMRVKREGKDCDARNYLRYTRDLTACNLEGLDFSDLTLDNYIFDYANLRGADFRGAKLIRASFKGADISLADFRSADLTGANLETNLDLSNFGSVTLLYSSTKLEKATYNSLFRVSLSFFNILITEIFAFTATGIRNPEKRGMIDIRYNLQN